MKTNLPTAITTQDQARAYLTNLYNNQEVYHPEDSAHDIIWNSCPAPTFEEAELMDKLMCDIYNLDGNNGNHANPIFDPCEFLLDLENAK